MGAPRQTSDCPKTRVCLGWTIGRNITSTQWVLDFIQTCRTAVERRFMSHFLFSKDLGLNATRLGCSAPMARLMESCWAASEERMMSALLPSATLILLCRAPSDSRIWARLRRSASACRFQAYSVSAGHNPGVEPPLSVGHRIPSVAHSLEPCVPEHSLVDSHTQMSPELL